jgi:hypothetical protein
MAISQNPGEDDQKFRVFHYPPELLNLLVDVIPLLCRSKRDTLLFFDGAGVPLSLTSDLKARVATNHKSISKYEIVRTILEGLNARHETQLRELREVVRRVVQFENFSSCWPGDDLKAKGLVSEIQKIVNVKDSFTRMKETAEKFSESSSNDAEKRAESAREKQREFSEIRERFFALFGETDAHKRGKQLEGILNDMFKYEGILVREAFTLNGQCSEGIIEQIDGVVEIKGQIYLVEFKWWNKPLGPGEVAQHIMRVFTRGGSARGIFFSYTEFTSAAITMFEEALTRGATVVAGNLEEIVTALNSQEVNPLSSLLKAKIDAAIIEKKPYKKFN